MASLSYAQATITCNEFDQEHDCITIQEVRWLLRAVQRYSNYYLYFLIRMIEGPRSAETINNLTLYTLQPNLEAFHYCVHKAKVGKNRFGENVRHNKHRRIVLDPFLKKELTVYLNIHMRIVDGVYVSPYPNQQIFPWTNKTNPNNNKVTLATQVVSAYWWKLKHKMKKAGFNSERKVREWVYDGGKKRTINVFVIRPHILRHFAASIYYYKNNKDIKATQVWMGHSNIETTQRYIHTAASIGLTEEEIVSSTWAQLLGFDEHQQSISHALATSQTALSMY